MLLASTTGGLLEYTASVSTGSIYYFKVKAFNSVDVSGFSLESAGMLAGSVASQPLDLQLVSQSEFQIKFEWTVPSSLGGVPLTKYSIYWDNTVLGETDKSLFVLAGVKLPDETFYTHSTDLVSGVTYQFYVVAENQVGSSLASDTIQIKAATTPYQITSLVTLSQSMYKITLGWTPNQDGGDSIQDYRVYWDNAADEWTQIAESTYGQTNMI